MPPSAPVALNEFLTRHDLSQITAANALGVGKAVLSGWLAGRTRPRPEYRKAIARWTAGAIPEEAWLSDDDHAMIERVQPFVQSPAAEVAA